MARNSWNHCASASAFGIGSRAHTRIQMALIVANISKVIPSFSHESNSKTDTGKNIQQQIIDAKLSASAFEC